MTKNLVNRVATLGILFWIVKIFSTTVGETAADYISVDLTLGLNLTTVLMGVLTILVAFWNFKQKKYYPPAYWLLIVMMSIEGTLITDILVDNLNFSLPVLDIVFSLAMILLFYFWHKKEQTLSIHTVNNNSRELFYWLIVLTTFALGTGIGDTISEYLHFGYLNSLLLFGAIFVLAGVLNYFKIITGTLAFWIAFIVTRPIGASLGDLFIQEPKDGGFGISAGTINIIFFTVIILSVLYLTINSAKQENVDLQTG